jgi:hypothetical protein
MRLAGRFLVVLLIAFNPFSIGSSPAHATASACGDGGKNFDGAAAFPQATYANQVSSEIEVRALNLCAYQSGSWYPWTGAWAMIARSSGSNNGYAQAGYFKFYSSSCGRSFFIEWNLNGDDTQLCVFDSNNSAEPTSGSFVAFEVVRTYASSCSNGSGGNCLFFNIDGACPTSQNHQLTCFHTNWDPNNRFNSTDAQFYGETHRYGDDMPGDDNGDTAIFRSITENNTLGNWNLTYDVDCPYYKKNVITNDQKFEIWTEPTNHNSTCT